MVEAVKTKEEETKFRWDREGNLISRTTGGKTLHSLPMPGSSYHLGDFGDDGRIATRYLPGDGRLIARMASLGKPEFFLEDGLGATRHTVSESGRPVPSAQPPVRRATVSDMFPMGVSRPAGASPRPSRIDSVSRPQLTHFEMPPRPQMPARPVLPEMSSRQQRPVHYTAPADAYWKAEPLEELVERGVPLPRLDPADYVKNFGIATSSILLSTLQGGVSHIPAVKEVPFLGSVLAPAVEAMRIEIVRHADPSVRQNLDRAQDAMKQGFGAVSVVTDAKDILSSSMKPAEWFQLRGYNTKSWVQHATFDAPPSTVRITTRNANEMVDGVSIWSRQGLGFNLDFPAFGKKAMEVFAKKAIRDTFYGELNELKTTTPALHDKSQPAIQARRPVEPFDGISKQLGGIELAAEAQVAGDLGQIHGAVYDPQTESIVLAGDESTGGTGIQAEDFAFALKLAYAEPPIDPQFSLDPDDPGNPSGAWQKAVYIPEEVLAGTSFGLALFEADWLLKQYAFGVRLDAAGYQHALRSRVPGFQSVADLSLGRSSGSPEKQSWNRFWIVSSEMKIRREGNSIVFDAPKMAVKAKKQVPDPKSRTGLRDVESSDDPDASRFAKFFTDHYDEIALEAPEFGRVRELAKAVAIAKWLRSMNVPIDREWVEKASSRRIPVPGKVTTLSTKWSVETRTPFEKEGRRGEAILTNSLRLSGGVDLTVQPSYVKDDNRAKTLFEGVQEKRKEQADSRVLSLEKGEFPRAIILPLSPTARKREGERKTVVAGGTEWKLNEQGRVAKGKTASGEETRYSYDASGRLAKVELEGKTGPRAWGERDADGSTWTFPDALGNQVKFHFSSDGSTIRLSGNAETIAEFSTSASGDETRWVKDGVTVSRSFDNEGRLQGGRITQKGPGSQSWDQPFSVTYGSDGRPASVDLPNLATTAWKYPAAPKPETGRASVTRRLMTGHETPATDEVEMTASTPFGQLAVKRGPDGAVREIRSSTGEELAFLDRPGETGKIRYRNAAREVEWTEEKGQSVFTEKLTGAGAAARPAVRKTVVLHDAERRITEVRYPDGTQASYSYREVPAAAGSKGPETHVSVVWSQAKGR
jgi:YD repeat-containing protein